MCINKKHTFMCLKHVINHKNITHKCWSTCFIFVLFFCLDGDCTAVTGGWVWRRLYSHSNNAITGFCSLNSWGFSWTRDYCLGEKKRKKMSLFFTCQSPSVSQDSAPVSLSCTHRYGWYETDNKWELGWEACLIPPSYLQIHQYLISIRFYSCSALDAGCCYSWWEIRGGCGKGVAWV